MKHFCMCSVLGQNLKYIPLTRHPVIHILYQYALLQEVVPVSPC